MDKSEVICYVCFKSFGDTSLLQCHLRENHSKPTFSCEICSREFASFLLLNQHINADHAGPHICEFCDMACATALGLKQHLIFDHIQMTASEEIQCIICQKPCSEAEIAIHLKTHDPVEAEEHRPFQGSDESDVKIVDEDEETVACKISKKKCSELEISSSNRNRLPTGRDNLKSHEHDHSYSKPQKVRSDKRVICGTCGSEMWQSNFNTHMRRHAGDNRAICETCGKKFFTVYELEKHLRVHTKEKPFTCNICNKNLSQRSILIRHMQIHTGKRFTCERCSMGYVSSHSLKRHVCRFFCKNCRKRFQLQCDKLDHEKTCSDQFVPKEERPRGPPVLTNCKICNKVTTEGNLKAHMVVHNRPKYTCEFCDKEYSYRYLLQEHALVHTENPATFLCDICGLKYASKKKLRVHKRKHNERRTATVCEVCGRAFFRKENMKRHLLVHTKEKPYTCSVCKKSFTQSGSLNIHMRYHTGERPYRCTRCSKGFVTKTLLKYHQCCLADL